MNKRITYNELADKVGSMVLCNYINTIDDDWYDCLFQGHKAPDNWDEEKDGEWDMPEIYQSYIITDSGAMELLNHTNEIVGYNSKINVFVWHVTHWGTGWNGVSLEYNEDAHHVYFDELQKMIKHL